MTVLISHIDLDVGEEAVDWESQTRPVCNGERCYRVLLSSVRYAFLQPGCHSIHCYPAVFSARISVLVKKQYVQLNARAEAKERVERRAVA